MFRNDVVYRLQSTQSQNIFLGIVLCLCILPKISGSESLTVSTYYPAPYGAYKNITATSSLKIAGSKMIVTGSQIASDNSLYIHSNNITFSSSGIDMTGSYLKNLCKWVNFSLYSSGGVVTDGKDLCGSTAYEKWMVVGMSSDTSGINLTATQPTNGYMLCCRIEVLVGYPSF